MQKIITPLLLIVILMACSSNKEGDEDEQQENVTPPEVVSAALLQQYPGVKAKWGKEDENFEASFSYNGEEMSAIYDATGSLIESEVEMEVEELPEVILNYMKENYQQEIQEAAKITKANGDIFYEAEIMGKDVVFDAKGNFMKEEKE